MTLISCPRRQLKKPKLDHENYILRSKSAPEAAKIRICTKTFCCFGERFDAIYQFISSVDINASLFVI